MNSIRKLMAVGTGAGALCVIVAFALAPVTVLAEGPHHWELWRGFGQSAKTTTPTAVTLSAACSAAVQTIKTAFADLVETDGLSESIRTARCFTRD